MIDPYRMVVINCLFFLFLAVGLLMYRYLFPKKNFNFLVVLVLFSILPIIHIFRPGTYESGDFNTHIYRAMEFYTIIKEGIFLPSWAGNLNATFGYPVFIFLNPLPYFLHSLIHTVGLSFVLSLKILLALSYIFSGVFFYLWLNKELKYSFAAFCGAIVYLFTPYHLVDLHFRVALGEVVFFMFLPLFFYSVYFLKETPNIQTLLFSSLSFSAMMFSHQAMTVFSLLIILPYFFLLSRNTTALIRSFILFLAPIFVGTIFSTYIWFPHIYYPQFTLAHILSNQTVIFPQFSELLFSPWRHGLLFQGPRGELSYLIGYTQLWCIILGLLLLLQKRFHIKDKQYIIFWLGISGMLIFMMTPLSTFFWNSLPILNTAQFATRFLLILTFVLSALVSYLVINTKRFSALIWVIILVTVCYTILNWGHRRVIPEINDKQLLANLPNSTSEGEGFCCMGEPKWTLPTRGWMKNQPKTHLQVLNGTARIQEIERTTTSHQYIVTVKTDTIFQENTWYFPGWNIVANSQPIPITVTTPPTAGLISFFLPKGLYEVNVRYTDLLPLVIAKVISVTSILTCVVLLFCLEGKKILYLLTNIHYIRLFQFRKKR